MILFEFDLTISFRYYRVNIQIGVAEQDVLDFTKHIKLLCFEKNNERLYSESQGHRNTCSDSYNGISGTILLVILYFLFT